MYYKQPTSRSCFQQSCFQILTYYMDGFFWFQPTSTYYLSRITEECSVLGAGTYYIPQIKHTMNIRYYDYMKKPILYTISVQCSCL